MPTRKKNEDRDSFSKSALPKNKTSIVEIANINRVP